MPKKTGENSKAVAAKERKNEKATAEKAQKQKQEEDAYWADDDKSLGEDHGGLSNKLTQFI